MSAKYGRYLTLQQIHDLTAPSEQAVATVTQWLLENGVSDIRVNSGGAFVRAVMPLAVAETLLDVTMHSFTHTASGVVLTRTLQHYSLPADVAELVAVVGGVARFPRMSLEQPVLLPLPNHPLSK